MNKTILLINPWIHDFAAFDFWIKPLGLLSVAAFLRKNGYQVEFIDCLDPWNPQMREAVAPATLRRSAGGQGKFFKERIAKPAALENIPRQYHRYGMSPHILRALLTKTPQPDLVLVTSMMTYWYPGVFEAIGMVKEIMPGVPVVLGGNYATLCPGHAARSGADFVLPGNGEAAIAAFMKAEFNEDLPFPADPTNLDANPYPAYDLVNHPDQLPIMTSRGCPFSCTYCASGILNTGFLRRDPDQVFAEIEFWNRTLGVRNFSLYDDAFLVQPQQMAVPLLEEVIKHHLACQFHCPNGLHLREVTDEIADLMFKAGFKTIRFGFETADIARQRETGGKVTNSDLQQAVHCLAKAGYRKEEIGIYLLCGLPGQSAEEVRESILFVKSCGARPILAEYSPIPGTALWDEAVQVSPFNIVAEPLYHNNTLLPCQEVTFTEEMYHSLKLLTRLPA